MNFFNKCCFKFSEIKMKNSSEGINFLLIELVIFSKKRNMKALNLEKTIFII